MEIEFWGDLNDLDKYNMLWFKKYSNIFKKNILFFIIGKNYIKANSKYSNYNLKCLLIREW